MKNKEVYNRLTIELEKYEVSKSDLAKYLGITLQQFNNKLNSKFVDIDFFEKCKGFCSSLDIEYILMGSIQEKRTQEVSLLKKELEQQNTIIHFLVKSLKGEKVGVNSISRYLEEKNHDIAF